MTSDDLVSVVIPIYNSQETIKETLQSLINQTHKNWEALVVFDQGTTDDSLKIAKSFNDPRIVILNSMGKSLAAARNLALLRAQGNWITFLDSDDLWKPQKLQIQLQMMKDHNWDFSVTGFSRINQQSRIISAVSMPKAKTDYWDLLKNNSISCLTVMISRKALGQSQFADSHQEDFIMWLEILKKGFTCQGIMQELALYRVLPNSRSSRVNRPLNRWKIMRQREKLSFPLALYYWLTYVFSAVAKRM